MNVPSNKRSRSAGPWVAGGLLSAAGVIATARLIQLRSRGKVDLRDKVIFITGGSRGLGLSLAFELGRLGSRLALCARDAAELEEARKRLDERGIEAALFPCDISKESEIEPLIERVLDRFGRVDVLINNAGLISVAPLDVVENSDFERAMNTMFWAPVNLSFAVLAHMKQRGSGRIVNITSVGGRVSIPHLLPYCCAKFALVAFSKGLSSELDKVGIRVLTVVPGLMRTGSYLNAEFKGSAEREFAWFGVLGNLPGFSVSAQHAARSIVKAIQRDQLDCTISVPAKLLIASDALLPEITQTILAVVNEYLLPDSIGKKQSLSGKMLDSSLGWMFQGLTSLGKAAAHELNE